MGSGEGWQVDRSKNEAVLTIEGNKANQKQNKLKEGKGLSDEEWNGSNGESKRGRKMKDRINGQKELWDECQENLMHKFSYVDALRKL